MVGSDRKQRTRKVIFVCFRVSTMSHGDGVGAIRIKEYECCAADVASSTSVEFANETSRHVHCMGTICAFEQHTNVVCFSKIVDRKIKHFD